MFKSKWNILLFFRENVLDNITNDDIMIDRFKNEEKRVKYKKNVYNSMVLITQFGINMLVPIFMCSFGGIYLDRKLGTSYWMIILFFIGALAGFRNVHLFAKKIYEHKEEGSRRERRDKKNTRNK